MRHWRASWQHLRGRPWMVRIKEGLRSIPTLPLRMANGPEKLLLSVGLRSPASLCLPNFLGIGAQKAGTTWLHENLRHHPDLLLPEAKEVHYFNRDFHRSLRSYSAIFEAGRDKVRGEITPAYSILPLRRIRFIRKIMPDVRLILLLRDPVDRAWSQALYGMVQYGERPYAGISREELLGYLNADWSVRRGDYLTILDHWLSVFPPEQMLIGFFEEIASDPQGLLSRVFHHIGVRSDVDWSAFPSREVVLKGPEIPMPPEVRELLEARYGPQREALRARLGTAADTWHRARASRSEG